MMMNLIFKMILSSLVNGGSKDNNNNGSDKKLHHWLNGITEFVGDLKLAKKMEKK